MIWPFHKQATGLEQAASTLNPFIVVALSDLDAHVLREQVRTRTLAECYVYGAIRYLASYDDMRTDCAGILLERMLARHFDADSIEVNNYMMFISEIQNGAQEQLFMIEGASALRRWLVEGDRKAGGNLKSLLGVSG